MITALVATSTLAIAALLALFGRRSGIPPVMSQLVATVFPVAILAFGYAAGNGMTLMWAVLCALAAAVGLAAGSFSHPGTQSRGAKTDAGSDAPAATAGSAAIKSACGSLIRLGVGVVGLIYATSLVTSFSGLNATVVALALSLSGLAIALGGRADKALGRVVFVLTVLGAVGMLIVGIATRLPGGVIHPMVPVPALPLIPALAYLIGIMLVGAAFVQSRTTANQVSPRKTALAGVVATLVCFLAVLGILEYSGGAFQLPKLGMSFLSVITPGPIAIVICAGAALVGAYFATVGIRGATAGFERLSRRVDMDKPSSDGDSGSPWDGDEYSLGRASHVWAEVVAALVTFAVAALAPNPVGTIAVLGPIAFAGLVASWRVRPGSSDDAATPAAPDVVRSHSGRAQAGLLTLAVGLVIAGVLSATSFNPVASTVGSPHSLLNAPELGTHGVDKATDFYKPRPVAPGTLPGTLRRTEVVAGAPAGIRVQRIVYISETTGGKPQEVSGLFAVKDGLPPSPNGRPLITVAHGTSGVAPGCGISLEPFRSGSNDAFWWYFYTLPMVNAGYAVVMSDYGNLGVPGVSNYMTMKGAAADVLNAARAAPAVAPNAIDASRIAIVGHSQGGYNALAAAYLWPEYAPELPIKGVVAMAPGLFPPTPLLQRFLESGPPGSSVAAGAAFNAHLADAVVSWSQNFPGLIKPSDVYSPKGLAGYETATKSCILETITPFEHPYTTVVNQPIKANVARLFDMNMPTHHKYDMPVLMQQGLKDTVVIPQANIAAYETFCKQGTTVVLQTYPADVHSSLLLTGWPRALTWLQDRFAGKRAPSTCT